MKYSIDLCNLCFTFSRLDKEELIGNGRIVTLLENGKHIRSEPSVIPLDG